MFASQVLGLRMADARNHVDRRTVALGDGLWTMDSGLWTLDSGLWKSVVWLSASRTIAVLLRDIVRVAWANLRSVNSIRDAG